MKKNGFTLIELLATIIIIGIIALIVSPVISGMITSARNAANARSVEGHIRNIELAIITDSFDTTKHHATIIDSIEGMTLPESDKVKCASYKLDNGTVIEAKGCSSKSWNKIYDYTKNDGALAVADLFGGTFIEKSDLDTYKAIVYMDPTKIAKKCKSTDIDRVTNKNIKNGCMKFYIYDDSGDSYKMILDHNTSGDIAWINKNDYLNASGLEDDWTNGNKYTIKGALTASKRLEEDTAGWIGTTKLISAEEIAEIVGLNITWSNEASKWFYLDGTGNNYSSSDGWQKQIATTASSSKYYWLYDNTFECTGGSTEYGCKNNDNDMYPYANKYNTATAHINGYWLSNDVSDDNSLAWVIDNKGSLSTRYANSEATVGIRPVIVISKALFNR